MGIFAADLRELVVRPTLEQLDQWSQAAENLLMGTVAQESQLGFTLQEGGLKGIYRISDDLHRKVWDEYLINHPETASRLRGLASQQQFLKAPHDELTFNLRYSTGVAWMIYQRQALRLPDAENIRELAKIWLSCFANRDSKYCSNAADSEAELEKFCVNYRNYVVRQSKELAA